MLFRPPGYRTTNVAALYGAAAGGYSPEAETLFAAMSPAPDDARKAVINTFIVGLIADGIWSKIDAMWVMRAHDAQAARLNWKSPSTFALTAVNSPTFTTDRGYAGNGSTSHLDTGWVPGTNGVNYLQDSACLAAYTNDGTATAGNTAYLCGTGLASGDSSLLPFRATGSLFRTFINSGNNTDFGTATTRLGLTAANRSGSTAAQGYKNGTQVGTSGTASAAPTTARSLFICATNSSGGRTGNADNIIGLCLVAASLDSTEHATLDTLWDAYVSATT